MHIIILHLFLILLSSSIGGGTFHRPRRSVVADLLAPRTGSMSMSLLPTSRVVSGAMSATTPHTVFVYGTLKRGFFNYDSVLLPGIRALRHHEDKGTAGGRGRREELQQSTPGPAVRSIGTKSATSGGPNSPPAYCRDLKLDATVNGAVLFADAYFIPYLILPDREAALHLEEAAGSDAPTSAAAATSTVEGELYGVNDEMLRRLDELEGVERGRYRRSIVKTRIVDNDGDDEDEEVDAFVYHLAETPDIVASMLRRKDGPTDALGGDGQEEDASVGVGGDDANAIRFLSSYRLEDHRRFYVPPGKERDESRYRSWGGYL